MTPEGKVKEKVKEILKEYVNVYWHMPVQNGMGSPSLDFIICANGLYLAIETKAPGGKPTPRQGNTMKAIRKAGGTVMLIDGSDYTELTKWLYANC